MDVDRSGALRRRRCGIRQRVLDEHRVAGQGRYRRRAYRRRACSAARSKQRPRACSDGSRDGAARSRAHCRGAIEARLRQHAIVEAECLDRAGIFRLAGVGIVAARHQQHGAVSRRGEDLMRIDAGIEFCRLRDRRADRAVGIDAMDGDIARIVIGRQQICAARHRRWYGSDATAAPPARRASATRPSPDRSRARWRSACRRRCRGRHCLIPHRDGAATDAARHIECWPAASPLLRLVSAAPSTSRS